MKTIFITNDDGYDAPGLLHLIEVASRFGRVVSIAPERPQSGMSQAITMDKPLFLKKIEASERVERYAFSGTPVDCVKIAFDHLLKDRQVDLALSGINHGSNSAANILYSGTMGGAIESSFYHLPSVGFSLDNHSLKADFTNALPICSDIIARVLEAGLQAPLCLNVNIPRGEVKGMRLVRQNKGHWREDFHCRQDPRGRDYFWLTGAFVNAEPEAVDTDEWALKNQFASIVPVQSDLTDYSRLSELKKIW